MHIPSFQNTLNQSTLNQNTSVFFTKIKIMLDTKLKLLTIIRHRLFLWSFILPLALLSACSSGNANAYNYPIIPQHLDSKFMRVDIINSFLIKTKTIDSLPVVELSDLAWDEDEQLLYAISDEGLLYHLTLEFKDKKIKAVNIIAAMKLRDNKKQPLKGKASDSEGLTIRNGNNGKKGDSELIISFENKPRIAIHSTDGHFLKKIKTIKELRKRKYYRGGNKALESVALHPTYGVITAPELPLKESSLNKKTIYSSAGKEWHFSASKVENSSITAIEVISEDKLLILERAYNGILSPIIISLRQLNINQCDNENVCETEDIALFSSADGWVVDNFEGLTHLRGNQYLMVSDNNKNPLQKTLLVLFEILDK